MRTRAETYKITSKLAWRFVGAFAIALAGAASAAAQTVVVGTGDPDIDVPAVQAAVDQGGEVMLRGNFSFDRPPMIPSKLVPPRVVTVLVTRGVSISGAQDGEMTNIEGGTFPFEVEAPGARVEIRGLRFIRPKVTAIGVAGVSGLVIASCRIERMEFSGGGAAIGVSTTIPPYALPTPTQPGHPEYVSGMLVIANNDIDVGGTALDSTVGVLIFSVGVPGAEVDIYVSGNNIRNTTEPAINIRRVGGRAHVVQNVLTTGSVTGTAAGPQVIRVMNIGSYLIAHNSIDCEWAEPDAEGIGVRSQVVEWPIERAMVVANDVTMSPPQGTVFGDHSAAIAIQGFAQNNVVENNRIRGRARAALSVDVFMEGIPANTSLILNDLTGFESSLADVFVDDGVMNTLIVGNGTVEDHGIGTEIVRVP